MKKRRIKVKEFEKQPTSTGLEETVPETAHGVIREGPSFYLKMKPWCNVLVTGIVKKGDDVSILEKTDAYWKVRTTNGAEGYIPILAIEEVPYG